MVTFKRLLVAAFVLIAAQFSFSQQFEIQHSAPLDEEPVEGWVKLLQLQNGNTALVHITEKDGIRTRIYDPNRKLIADKTVEPQLNTKGKLKSKNISINAVLELANQIVLFINTYESRTPALYRVIIDSSNGALLEEQIVVELEQTKLSFGPVIKYRPKNKFFVRKDQFSDNYAVAFFSASENYVVYHFSGTHQLINKAKYRSDTEDDLMGFKDLLVMGSEKVISLLSLYNYDQSKGLFLALLEKDKGYLLTKQLNLNDELYTNYGVLKFDKNQNQILLLSLSSEKRYSYSQVPKILIINPEDYSIIFSNVFYLPDVKKDFKSYANKKGDFNALPQSLHINEDGTYTIIYEEVTVYSREGVVTNTLLGSNVICILDNHMKLLSYQLIPKNHSLLSAIPTFYPSFDRYPPRELISSNSYKGYSYANSGSNKYFIFNDTKENLESVNEGKISMIAGISGTDTFICTINDKGEFERELLYGEPEKKVHNFSMVVASEYNPSTGYYATLNLKLDRKKKSTVTWIKLN